MLPAHGRPRRASSTQRRRAGAPGSPSTSSWRRWRAGARRPRRGAARLPGGQQDAVVRPADVPGLDGHRPLHGDLGARPRRRRRPRRRARAAPTGSGTSPTSACAPATSPSASTSSSRRPRRPRRADRAARRDLDLGARGRRAAGHRVGVRLLPAGHPARPPRRHRPGRDGTPTPTGGSTSPRPSPAHRAAGRAGGRGANAVQPRNPAAGRQLLRLLRRPALRDARDARGRRTLDVLTGDYLAELTMLILGRDR